MKITTSNTQPSYELSEPIGAHAAVWLDPTNSDEHTTVTLTSVYEFTDGSTQLGPAWGSGVGQVHKQKVHGDRVVSMYFPTDVVGSAGGTLRVYVTVDPPTPMTIELDVT